MERVYERSTEIDIGWETSSLRTPEGIFDLSTKP